MSFALELLPDYWMPHQQVTKLDVPNPKEILKEILNYPFQSIKILFLFLSLKYSNQVLHQIGVFFHLIQFYIGALSLLELQKVKQKNLLN